MHRNDYYNISNRSSFRYLKFQRRDSLFIHDLQLKFHHLPTYWRFIVWSYLIALFSVLALWDSNLIILNMFLSIKYFFLIWVFSFLVFSSKRIHIVLYHSFGCWKYCIYLHITIFCILYLEKCVLWLFFAFLSHKS